MKRYWIAFTAIVAASLLFYFFYARAETADPEDDLLSWPPDAAAIRQAIGAPQTNKPEDIHDARHLKFAALYENRYRHHDPAVAIGVRFLSSSVIKLMCPARMEPWRIDRVAVDTWQETRALFGHAYNIDIYETYIGMPPIKIGELRPMPGNAQKVHIAFRYPAINQNTKPADNGATQSNE